MKAGLKRHALNNYIQAAQMYKGRELRLAEDHVNFTMARLLNQLQIPDHVVDCLKSLLITPSPQPPQQIMTFYKEFLTVVSVIIVINILCSVFLKSHCNFFIFVCYICIEVL